MMNEKLVPGQQVKAKLKLETSLEVGDEERLIRGEVLSKKVYVEFRNKENNHKLWPVLLSREREKILIETIENNGMIAVKLGKWSNRVSVHTERGGISGTGGYVDSTFNCPWSDFKSSKSEKIFEKKMIDTGGREWVSLRGGEGRIRSEDYLGRLSAAWLRR